MRLKPLPIRTALAAAALASALAASPALAQDGASAAPAAAAPALSLGVHEHVVANGLTVLTIERPQAPRATCWMFMKTGSVNERPGITGISHLFEHLMFKGTHEIGVKDFKLDQELQPQLDACWKAMAEAVAAGDVAQKEALAKRFDELKAKERENDVQDELWDLYLSNGGTGLNAFTAEDMTAYIVTVPSNKVELFMWLESDRLAHAVFREFYAERDVVKEERRLDENSPDGPYNEQLNAAFFMAMPYHWPVLGWMSDLDAITPADCRAYFDIYYAPNNATLVVVGAVKHEEVEALADRYFGRVPRGQTPPPAIRTREPAPCGERRLTVVKQARPRASLLFHCPKIADADGPALDVAQMVLSGKSGRLYESLVEKQELCVEVRASHEERRWAGVFEVEGYARGATAPKKVADALQAELDKLAGGPPCGADELARAKDRLQADLWKQLEEPEQLTNLVGAYAVKADWRLVEKLPQLWQAVTAADVQRVAKKYLAKDLRTLGLLEMGGAEETEEVEPGDKQEKKMEEQAESPKTPAQGGARTETKEGGK